MQVFPDPKDIEWHWQLSKNGHYVPLWERDLEEGEGKLTVDGTPDWPNCECCKRHYGESDLRTHPERGARYDAPTLKGEHLYLCDYHFEVEADRSQFTRLHVLPKMDIAAGLDPRLPPEGIVEYRQIQRAMKVGKR